MGEPRYIDSYVSDHATGPIVAHDERGKLVVEGLMPMSRAKRPQAVTGQQLTKREADREPGRRDLATD